MLARSSIILCLFILSNALIAQSPHPVFKNFTTKDGLPSSEVHHCIQDKLGYMWFATDNGLCRYNGYEFKIFGIEEGLLHNVVFYLQKDHEDKLWLATMHGHLYYVENDSIVAFENNYIIEENNPGLRYIADDFFIDIDGTKYLSLHLGGIIKFDANGQYELIISDLPNVENVAFKTSDRWLISYHTNSSSKANPNMVGSLQIRSDSSYVLKSFISFDIRTSKNNWIKEFNNNEIYRFNRSTLYKIDGENSKLIHSYGFEVKLKAVFTDRQDRILLGGLFGSGVRRYPNLDAFEKNEYEQFLEDVSITSIYEDSHGGLWFTTIERGVFYCSDLDVKVFDSTSDFPSDHISAIAPIDLNLTYVGFRNGELIVLDKNTNSSLKIESPEDHDIIYDLLYDSNREELWMTNRRLNLFKDGKWTTFKKLQYNNKHNISSFTKFLEIDKEGEHLFGSHTLGFGILDLNSKALVYSSESKETKSRTYHIYQDNNRKIWVANINGLFEFKNGSLCPPHPFHSEFSTRTEAIGSLTDTTLVMGTKGEGVLLWKENFFKKIKKRDGLSSDMVERIHIDKYDQIWVATLHGLNKIWKNDEAWHVDQFTTSNGLPSNEISDIKSKDSIIWIATTKGLLKWTDKPFKAHSTMPIIESIWVNNELYNLESNPTLPYKNNNLRINALSINYRQNGNIEYRLRLNNGLWNYSRERSFYFANLSPGNYKFEIQAQNENRVWSQSKELNFYIKPPFWRTPWFFVALSVIIILTTWYLVRTRINNLKQSLQQEKKIQELKYSALRAQMNPHFIFNCLNSIQRFILDNNEQSANSYLSRFAQLIRISLNASVEKTHSLDQEIQLLDNYLALEKLRFKEKFNYSIQVDPNLDLYETVIPPLLTQPLVENAIIHGMKHKTSGGLIEISFLKKDTQLHVVIKDNGRGIYHEDKHKSQNVYQHKSIGMHISKRRLSLANLANKITIHEEKDDEGKITGTVIELFVHQNDFSRNI